ncbi:MAG: hypothetical protein AVDCRST_MAG30-306 [uncultured Solirubrobacteraceae bacterium]|uniref:Uncharacterized protein n=1 Tax=uncultured Solirubrobacteraceae bacterium TaxID=1162706 RepID=A0A6J4RIZ8_9ACTN|nr:MAG: hypothetical protein AVDCRST_MAG30-306 [uncultured Solirubrobacteraceae bacterium]
MLPFFSSFDLLVAASVVSAVTGLGSAIFLLARRQQASAIPSPEVVAEVAEAAEAPQPAAA